MSLINAQILAARPNNKRHKLADEKSLYLLIDPTGSRWWRMKYRFGPRPDGKPGKAEKVFAIGVYPDISLKQARERRDDARKLLAKGIDPNVERKANERAQRKAYLHTFEATAKAWIGNQLIWSEGHRKRTFRRLENHVFAWIGKLPIEEVPREEMRAVLRRIVATGRIETAHRVLDLCSCVFTHANNEEITDRNPCQGLKKGLSTFVTRDHPTITDPKRVGQLMLDIDAFEGTIVVACALRLEPLVFLRQSELRKAKWNELDLEGEEEPTWRIPAERMKMKEQHLVPLSKQAVAILKELRPLTGRRSVTCSPACALRRGR